MKTKKANRLIKEKSPYLQQHAYNPVDWYPWGEEAFEKAEKEDKPVFLSIGYSTCHWCHVMERESFEDEEIARILNENYVPVKVDREERPDIDSVYMSVCQMLTGSGGWPLTIIMTPDRKPFFAGTYFPKESIYRRPGLKDILLRIAELWRTDRQKVLTAASQIVEALSQSEEESYIGEALDEAVLHKGFAELYHSYDETYGGFGNALKFPIPHNLLFLLRYYRRTGNEKALHMVSHTLKKMRLGGIWDHVGFGFHRYSTDREWLLPHFEKMLYDNALLMVAYSEAYQATGEEFFAQVVEEVAEYLIRDMLSPEGAFYSAEDADSEGEEGKFYTWTLKELEELLNEEELKIAFRVFGIEEEGNFLEEATRRRVGKNILHMKRELKEYAEELGYEPDVLKQKLEEIRSRLFKKREERVRPLRDEKILTDWNGLAIAGFAKAGVALGRRDFVQRAQKAADFILGNMFDEEGRLLHRYKDGEASINAFLEDYAYLVWGLTELYEASFETRYLKKAKELTDFALEHFWDEENLGFFHTPDFGEKVLVRKKDIYDGATPSGNSVMAYNLVRLGRLLGNRDYERRADQTLRAFSQVISSFPGAHTFSLLALDLLVKGSFELIGVGEGAREVLLALERAFLPEGLFGVRDELFEELSEMAKGLHEKEGKTTYYLCRNFSCEAPITDPDELRERLIPEKSGTPG
ncbi:thioredoxin domain-containing protein [Hydrogenivirga sp.]